MIIVIGASGGIGDFLYNKYKCLEENIVGTCFSNNANTNLYPLNIKDYEQIFTFAEQFTEDSKIVLINCSAINYNVFLHKSDPERWYEVIDTNLMGSYNLVRAFLPMMRKKHYGRIINFSSIVAQVPTCGVSAYATSKAALWGLAKSVAAENASMGITINNINLGYSNIGMGINDVPENIKKVLLDRLPAKEFCGPEDIFTTVEYIRNTPFVNGTALDINGAMI